MPHDKRGCPPPANSNVGQAFNISNNEAVKNEDMWFTVMKVIKNYAHPEKVKSTLDLVFIPEQPLWCV